MTEMFLNEKQVIELLRKVGADPKNPDEVVVIRCIRKTAASREGGPDKGETHDLHVVAKPKDYVPKGDGASRVAEDEANGVLTVYVNNRKDEKTGAWGAWRRVNVRQVTRVILSDGTEYSVRCEK